MGIARLMQDCDDNDPFIGELIEECVWEPAEKNAPKRSMHKAKRQRVFLRQGDCVVDRCEEIFTEIS
jgi:hypothetical protein